MIASHPLNSDFLALIGDTSKVSNATFVGQTQPRKIEFYLDFMLLDWADLTNATDIVFAGAYPGWGWFEAAMPGTATSTRGNTALARFGVSRNSVVSYSATGTVTLGQRHVMLGQELDELAGGPSAWLDGEALATTESWTAQELFLPLDTKAGIDFGYDDFNLEHTKIRIYEAWVKINDVLVLHYRPDVHDDEDGATTMIDRSGYGNTGTIDGVLDTAYRWGASWNRVGSVTGVPL